MKINTDLIYPVGSHYVSENSANPSSKLGGTWELVRRTYGGELLAYGVAKNTETGSTTLPANQYCAMSDLGLSVDIKDDYSGQNVLWFDNGAFRIYPQGIVGMIKATSIVTGYYNTNIAIWWEGNGNSLPTGVFMSPSDRRPLLGGSDSDTYGGCIIQHFYKVNSGVNQQFFINPSFLPYNGAFRPGTGGVGICLEVEVFAATGLHHIWKRIA